MTNGQHHSISQNCFVIRPKTITLAITFKAGGGAFTFHSCIGRYKVFHMVASFFTLTLKFDLLLKNLAIRSRRERFHMCITFNENLYMVPKLLTLRL